MSRYIDEEWLKQNFNTVFWSQITKTIDSAPSIDIVRCGECKWFDSGKNDSEIWSMCTRHFGKYIDVNADDFCSYGERSEKPNNCELQTIRCPKCGRTDYIRNMEKDMGIKGSCYEYKCINCNTYIKTEPQTERSE